MAIFKISDRVIRLIQNRIEDLFDRVKTRFLGPRGVDRHTSAIYDSSTSLPSMYVAASKEEGGLPNLETLSILTNTSKNYLDALKLKTINTVIKDLEEHVHTQEDMNRALEKTWKRTTSELQRIVETETQGAKNIALLDGIIRSNRAFDVDDPSVAFIIVRDGKACDECIRLHVSEDGVTPKVYKLSELSKGYHIKGSSVPSVYGTHPRCRCQLVTLLPGYGYNKSGKIAYIKKGHDEYKAQRE